MPGWVGWGGVRGEGIGYQGVGGPVLDPVLELEFELEFEFPDPADRLVSCYIVKMDENLRMTVFIH